MSNHTPGPTAGNGVANAHLIKSAPTLLEACEAAEYWLDKERENPGQATPDEILRVLREAIASAQPSTEPFGISEELEER